MPPDDDMDTSPHRDDPPEPHNGPGDGESNGREGEGFLSALCDELARSDPSAHAALLEACPELLDETLRSQSLGATIRNVLRLALVAPSNPSVPGARAAVRATAAAWSTRRDPQAEPVSSGTEPPGVLTSLTRQLTPERAMDLYRKIAPMLVYQLLHALDARANLSVMHTVVHRLCGDAVQRRLRAAEHVRDVLLEELADSLSASGALDGSRGIGRADVEEALRASGATARLAAMENCIRLAARAG